VTDRWRSAAPPPGGDAAGWRRWGPGLGGVVAVLLAARMVAPLLGPEPAAAPAPAAAAPAPGATPPPAAGRGQGAGSVAGLDGPTATELLLGAEDGLLRVDLDARSVRAVSLPGRAAGADGGLVGRPGAVVAVRGGFAYAAPQRPGRPATWLGPAAYALASARPGRVWLVEQTGDPDRWFRVREVALGGPAGRPRVVARGTLALGRRPVAGVPGGLLLTLLGPGGGLAVWDQASGRVRPRLAAARPLVLGASGHTVAWVEGPDLHLGDLASGRDRVVPPPLGSDGFAPAGAFSPDGRILAAVTRVGFSTRPALALVAVDWALAMRIAGSEGALADRCSPCLTWAPAGNWVFFNRLGPGLGIGAYRLGRPRAATLDLEVPGSYPPSFASL
jgi:hypothetical protein